MENKYDALIKLIQLFDNYSKEKENVNLGDFADWMKNEVAFSESAEQFSKKNDLKNHSPEEVDFKIASYLMFMNKHLKHYGKQAIDSTELSSIEDFTFLNSLIESGSLRKMELINKHFMFIPSGIEVIRRLLRKNLIEERVDPQDRRSKRVQITDLGVEVFNEVRPKMFQIAKFLGSELSTERKNYLLMMLREWNKHHALLSENEKILKFQS